MVGQIQPTCKYHRVDTIRMSLHVEHQGYAASRSVYLLCMCWSFNNSAPPTVMVINRHLLFIAYYG